MASRANRHMVVVSPEADLVARLNPELVTQLFRDDNLTFGADTMSHTSQYNLDIGSLTPAPKHREPVQFYRAVLSKAESLRRVEGCASSSISDRMSVKTPGFTSFDLTYLDGQGDHTVVTDRSSPMTRTAVLVE